MNELKLTQYSHGAGCGCKISPKALASILKTEMPPANNSRLIVGNESHDDAAVYDIGDGTAIISTTDFFMPIVDDPFTFGKIAAANAISDVYAMGGEPLLAIAVFGWPIHKIPLEAARLVLEGGRYTCAEAGIPLAGGHSIDSPEPIFGLAVTGRININNLKKNNTATAGCLLYLTKPLGVGILTTAQKQDKLNPVHYGIAEKSMSQLNIIGKELATIKGLKAMTDVTGFGLLGHLMEMCEGSGLSAQIEFEKIPVFPEIFQYIQQGCIPGGTYRNWDSYGQRIMLAEEIYKTILCDPQTSGGLLLAVERSAACEVQEILKRNHINPISFGVMISTSEIVITVN